ncbi:MULTISPECIES: arsenic resistance N-acetyltransferase ArsN2 [Agrobacterium]|uniref:GNAT family N-acetyltransferase n=3 Tax=Rhizobium/Agrobacterium group TaxID=227290 RepID=A0A2Z2PYQ3_AGRTU|nr:MULTISPECIES: arsenic resistance N-acetyltransferase ArsN2 [Agrobacterium]ASK43085.1 GNAT family N-acetyltransferase [Agrobacterium deltaense]ASK46779.1 GNAT family N-acetyltransferase [Agrobacterium radiobacter]ASK47630.1 GNAT family N-acetyltransferase [Agrobacterium radiobacter]ASK47976.1 GNAT family N-acetyltransferase [Agrobacterium deltaense]ASK48351.1 GNAT family N-acetyltransferase [Agrobacterium deltaense]
MLSEIALHEVAGSDARLREALRAADLPTDDIEDDGRVFLEAVSGDGQTVGYAGLERCSGDYLLRSVVVLPAHQSHGFGRSIVETTLRDVDGDVFLATTSAAPFFSSIGFSEVRRAEVPAAVLATRQLSSICPSSATIMKLNRPPT